jgi:serine/threonine protein kinase
MTSSPTPPSSACDSPSSDKLSPEQEEQLSRLLEEYFESLERGRPLTRAELEGRCPELAAYLGEYLASIDFLQGAAVGFRPSLEASQADKASEQGNVSTPTPAGEPADAPIVPQGGAGSFDPLIDPLIARRLGDYRIVRELGRGGMGVVYEAVQESMQRKVALKVLPMAALLDAQQITRFRNEAQMAGQLHHPHIVPVFAVGFERGVHFYVMQLIEGRPLDQVISEKKKGARRSASLARGVRRDSEHSNDETILASERIAPPLPSSLSADSITDPRYLRGVVEIAAQAADALEAAHEAGVVHRDIKPSNLMVTPEGRLWVTDFGLARCRAGVELTRPGDMVGTMRYMSPEQAKGPALLIDHRADIYSLGATLYELLTLHPALRGESPTELLKQLETGHPYPPRSWNEAIPFELETVVLKALSKSRDERYTSAKDFADDLRRFLDGRPVLARRPSLLDRLYQGARRRRRTVAAGAAALIVVAVSLAVGMAVVVQQRERAEFALRVANESFSRYREQLAVSNNQLALLYEQQGNAEQAQACYEEAIRLEREALREDPTLREARRTLASTLGNLAMLRATAEPEKAEQWLDEGVEIQRELAAASPRDRSLAAGLALSLSNRGSFKARLNRLEQAVVDFDESIQVLTQLHQDGPGDRGAARDLAVCLNNRGMSLHRLEKLGESERSFRDALAVLPMGKADDPGRAASLSSRGGIEHNLGLVLEKQGRTVDAIEALDRAIVAQEEACRVAPAVDQFRRLLRQHRELREKIDNSSDTVR